MIYSELTKTSTALACLAVLFVLSAARRLVLIFVNSLYMERMAAGMGRLFAWDVLPMSFKVGWQAT